MIIDNQIIHIEDMNLLKNALDFSNVKARDCMIPRTEIIAVDIDDSLDTVMQLFIAKGLSKVIIYRDSIDNIIGYVHSYDLFKSPKSIDFVEDLPRLPSGKIQRRIVREPYWAGRSKQI
mgnify:CR=1 FL=1